VTVKQPREQAGIVLVPVRYRLRYLGYGMVTGVLRDMLG